MGMLLLFHRLLTSAGRTMGTWFGFGLVAGLGLWFCPTAGVTLGACGLTWLVLMGLPRIGEFCAATGGAALGLVPWLGYNLQYGFPGLDRILEMFGYLEPIDPWIEMSAREKAWNLVSNDWLEGIITPWLEPLLGALAGLLQLGYGLPFALGLILFAARLVRGGGSTRRALRWCARS